MALCLLAACEAPVVVHPITGEKPAAPTLVLTPAGPSSRRHVTLTGVAPPRTTVRVYASSVCAGQPLQVLSAVGLGAGAVLDVVPSSVNTFTADAVSPLGAVSDCSSPVRFEHRPGLGPRAPRLVSISPPSPSPVTAPVVRGVASPGDTVQIYADLGCAGSPVAVVSDGLLAEGVQIELPQNAWSWLSADVLVGPEQSDCSTPISYVNDTIAPDPPVLVVRGPSPSSDAWPQIGIRSGSLVQGLELFRGSDCDGGFIPSTGWTYFGTQVGVDRNAVTTLSALAWDEAGNKSGCGPPLTYEQDDSLAPRQPYLLPNGTSWTPLGELAAGFEVDGQGDTPADVFLDAGCHGPPFISRVVPAPLYSRLTVQIPADAGELVTISARSMSWGGTPSICSEPASVLLP